MAVACAALLVSLAAASCAAPARPTRAGARAIPAAQEPPGTASRAPATAADAPTTTTAMPPATPRAAAGGVASTAASRQRPYPVREVTLALVDTSRPTVSHGREISRSRALTTLVWLPDAPGRWPLVVFAHGFEVGPAPYEALLEAWAAHGYVVAAPEFPLTDAAVAGPYLDESDIDHQPADVRFVTDSLVAAGGPLASHIDPRRVAVAGHSDGAETALAASIAPAPAGEPAYRAVIAMSVQPLPGVASTANPPILVTQGDADTINPPAYGYQTWDRAAAPRYLLILHGGGHLPPLEAGSRWLAGVEATTESFLDCYVAGDAAATAIAAAAGSSPLFSLYRG